MSILKHFIIPGLKDPEPPQKDTDAEIIRETLEKRAANLLYYNNPRSTDNFWSQVEKMSDSELIQIIRDFRD